MLLPLNLNLGHKRSKVLDNKMLVSFLANRWHCPFESPQWKGCRGLSVVCLWCHAPVSVMAVVFFLTRRGLRLSGLAGSGKPVCSQRGVHGQYLQFIDSVPFWVFTRVSVAAHGAIFSWREVCCGVCLSRGGDLEKSSWKSRLSAELREGKKTIVQHNRSFVCRGRW